MLEEYQVPPVFPTESIKIVAESIGIPSLTDDVAKELAEDVTFRLKVLIQVSFIIKLFISGFCSLFLIKI